MSRPARPFFTLLHNADRLVGFVRIPQHHEQEAVDPPLVAPHDLVKVGASECLGGRRDRGCQCRIHAVGV